MNSKPLFQSAEDVIFILPTRDVSVGEIESLSVISGLPAYPGHVHTLHETRRVYVVESRERDFAEMRIASLMWRYGFRGALMAKPNGLWIVYPQGPSVLRGVRLHTKGFWQLVYGLVDDILPP